MGVKYTINAFDIKLCSLNKKYVKVGILTKEYRKYKEDLEEAFNQIEKPEQPLEGRIKTRIEVGMYLDIDNILKPIHDILQKCNIIKNDKDIVQTIIKKIPQKRGAPEWLKVEVMEDDE